MLVFFFFYGDSIISESSFVKMVPTDLTFCNSIRESGAPKTLSQLATKQFEYNIGPVRYKS